MTGIRNAGEYRIQASGDTGIHAEDRWVAVLHEPCGGFVFGDSTDDSDEIDLASLLSLVAAHHCAAAGTTEG